MSPLESPLALRRLAHRMTRPRSLAHSSNAAPLSSSPIGRTCPPDSPTRPSPPKSARVTQARWPLGTFNQISNLTTRAHRASQKARCRPCRRQPRRHFDSFRVAFRRRALGPHLALLLQQRQVRAESSRIESRQVESRAATVPRTRHGTAAQLRVPRRLTARGSLSIVPALARTQSAGKVCSAQSTLRDRSIAQSPNERTNATHATHEPRNAKTRAAQLGESHTTKEVPISRGRTSSQGLSLNRSHRAMLY